MLGFFSFIDRTPPFDFVIIIVIYTDNIIAKISVFKMHPDRGWAFALIKKAHQEDMNRIVPEKGRRPVRIIPAGQVL